MATTENNLWLECQNIRSILPDNVWTIIFDNLDNSPDALESLSNSSPYFRQRLLLKRKLFLIGKVLDEVVGWLKPDLGEGIYLWHDVKKYQVNSLLNYRLVCSSWRNAIDQLFLTEKSLHTDNLRNGAGLHSWTPTTVNQFVDHFKDTHLSGNISARRCPYMIKRVKIEITNNDVSNQLPRFQENYGFHISKLIIYVDRNAFPSQLYCYRMLVSVLTATTHLTHLEILSGLEQDDSMLELTEEINGPKLPELKYLVELKVGKLSIGLSNRLLQSSTNIKKLELLHQEVDKFSFCESFPNLTEVRLGSPALNFKTFAGTIYDCNISKLNLTFGWRKTCEFKRLGKVFDLIPPYWSSTVNELTIDFPEISDKLFEETIFRDSIRCRLNLPHVKKLKLQLCHVVGLNFLLSMTNCLEELEISRSYRYEKINEKEKSRLECKEVIQCFGFTDKMYESNIWTYFPKLCVINCNKDGVFYRHEWIKQVN